MAEDERTGAQAASHMGSSHPSPWLRALVAHAPAGLVLFDRQGRFTFVNDRLAEINGVPAVEHLGRTPAEVVPALADVGAELLSRVLAGEGLIEVDIEGETPAAPGRSRSWHETWFPVTADDGELLGAGAIIVETTERQRAAARAEYLAKVTTDLVTARTRRDVARAVLDPVIDLLGARGGMVAMAADDGTSLELLRLEGYPAAVGTALEGAVPAEVRLPVAEAFRTAVPVFVESRDQLGPMREATIPLAELVDDHAWACAPLAVDGRLSGAWGVSFDHPRTFDGDERQFFATVTSICAGAMVRAAQFERARSTSIMLQHSLLPTQAAEVDGYEVCARYRAATTAEVGGDWYDVITASHPSGVGFSVGDVTGHSVEAAAVMGRIRNRLVGLAALEPRPGAVLARLNDIVAPEHGFATTLFGRVRPESGAVVFASAGHPPPLVHRRGAAAAEWADVVPNPPVGVPWRNGPAESSLVLEGGDTLVLVTDGLYEDRHADLDASLDRVAEVVGAALADGGDLDDACDRIVEAAFASRHQEDDVCVLAIRRRI